MKTSSIISAILFVFAISFTASARQANEPPVKILPTTQKGVLKVLFAFEADQDVEVKFYNNEGIILTDKINKESYPNGFSKKYDVSSLKLSNYWVEVSSPRIDVTYKITTSKDGFQPLLEKTTYNHLMVAAKN